MIVNISQMDQEVYKRKTALSTKIFFHVRWKHWWTLVHLRKNYLDFWPMTLKSNRVCAIDKVLVRAKYHQAKCCYQSISSTRSDSNRQCPYRCVIISIQWRANLKSNHKPESQIFQKNDLYLSVVATRWQRYSRSNSRLVLGLPLIH